MFLVFVFALANERYLFIAVGAMAVMPDRHSKELGVTCVFALLDVGRMLLSYRPRNKINDEHKQLRSAEEDRQCQ